MDRAAFDDLLGIECLTNDHINAFALVLNAKKSRSNKSYKNYLYVSPTHAVFF